MIITLFCVAGVLVATSGQAVKNSDSHSHNGLIPRTYQPVVDALWDIFVATPDLAATVNRLAWHSAGTYNATDGTGGSNGGHIYFDSVMAWGSNAGLGFLRPILDVLYVRFEGLTRADLYILAGIVATAYTDGPWVEFCGGRHDALDDSDAPADDLLPGAEDPRDDVTTFSLDHIAAHMTAVFSRMGFNDQELVALLGAHSIGRMHAQNSGYIGTWDTTEFYMNSEYYTALMLFDWNCFALPNGLPQYAFSGDPSDPLVCDAVLPLGLAYNMNPADLALKTHAPFRNWTAVYAADQDKFHEDFALAWHKLMHLGVTCDASIKIVDLHNQPSFTAYDIFELGYQGAAQVSLLVLLVLGMLTLMATCVGLCFCDAKMKLRAHPATARNDANFFGGPQDYAAMEDDLS